MKIVRRSLRFTLALVAAAGALAVAVALYRSSNAAAAARVPDLPVPVVELRGQAAAASWHAIRESQSNAASRAMIIALRAVDCFTCEDLGRQLREILHAPGTAGRAVAVVTPAADRPVVRSWLRRERMGDVAVVGVGPGLQLVGLDSVPTPAVLLMDSVGRVERGIAHPQRVRNVRVRSFTAELRLE